MSRRQNKQQSRNYANYQEHIYHTHEALQNLTTHISSIHTWLIRTSSALLDISRV